MAVNRYQNHLVVYLEDQPYREIMNGVKNLPHINDKVIDVKNPCGGWKKVFVELEENFRLIEKYSQMYALLLMDFDNDFVNRQKKFQELCNKFPGQERIFLLGIDKKESEDLKKTLQQSNNEAIGKILLENCPDQPTSNVWDNPHLHNNLQEIERMRKSGIFQWLFRV